MPDDVIAELPVQDVPAVREAGKQAEQASEPEATDESQEQENTEAKADDDADKEADGDEDEDAGGEEKPKRPSGAQRQKRREERLRAENAELYSRLEMLERASQPQRQDQAAAQSQPQEKDFNGDYLAYERAMNAWTTAQEVEKAFAKREQSFAQQRAIEARREIALAYAEQLDDARERIPDFDATMREMRGINVNDAVIDEIMASDKGPLLAYHLAKNPDKLRMLNGLHGRELAREVGRLEGNVRMPVGNKQTSAKPPPTPVKGGAAAGFDPFRASMEEYAAHRKKQLGYK